MQNGKVLSAIIGGVALAAIVAAGSAVRQTWANEINTDRNTDDIRKIQPVVTQAAVLAEKVENLANAQEQTNERLDKLLDKLEQSD